MDNVPQIPVVRKFPPLLILLMVFLFLSFVFIYLLLVPSKKAKETSKFEELKNTPTSTISFDISEWNTFINKKAGYLLKYPANDWRCDGQSYDCPYQHPTLNIDYIRPEEPTDCGLSIQTLDNPDNLSPIDFWKEETSEFSQIIRCGEDSCLIENPSTKLESILFFSNNVIGKEKGTRISGQMELFSDQTYLPSKKGVMLKIKICRDELNEKILSTFQLLGDMVSQSSPAPSFYPTPTEIPYPTPMVEEIFCGGLANIPCSEGYWCKSAGNNIPDEFGTCIKKTALHNLLNLIFGRQD